MSDDTGSFPLSSSRTVDSQPRRRGYQETRRQDRDRREKRSQRVINGSTESCDSTRVESAPEVIQKNTNGEKLMEECSSQSSIIDESKDIVKCTSEILPEQSLLKDLDTMEDVNSAVENRVEHDKSVAERNSRPKEDKGPSDHRSNNNFVKDRFKKETRPVNRNNKGKIEKRSDKKPDALKEVCGDHGSVHATKSDSQDRGVKAKSLHGSVEHSSDKIKSLHVSAENSGGKGKHSQGSVTVDDKLKSSHGKAEHSTNNRDSNSLIGMLKKTKIEKSSTEVESKDKGMSVAELEAQWQQEEQERKHKAEQEEKRNIEAAQLKEEEKKQEEELAAKRLIEEEESLVETFVRESQYRTHFKQQLRQRNLSAADSRQDESTYTKLDSNLKKCTAFVKKLRNLTESQEESLLKDIHSLNLSKYIGEVASAFTEAKLKMSDIWCALTLCSVLHQRYSEFAPALLENWQKVLLSKKEDKITNASKLRVDLRLFADLITIGVFTEKEAMTLLSSQLLLLIKGDMREHNNISILISFCRHCGDDYAGLIPTKYRLLGEKHKRILPRSGFLKEERQLACRKLLKEYHASLYKRLPLHHKEVKAQERANQTTLMTKGELSEESKQRVETAQQSFHKLWQNATTYADLVDEAMPDLPVEVNKEDDIMSINIFSPDSQHVYDGERALFEDEDTRQFYENLPDLKAVVPQILYKDSEAAQAKSESEPEVLLTDDINVEDLERELCESGEVLEAEVKEDLERDISPAEQLKDEDFDIAGSMKLILEEFLSSLPNCVNREMIDKAANDFCLNLNTKANRKKLTRTLFGVHRTRYDLLPFYARLVAILLPCMPDIAIDLNSLLKNDFRYHVRKKDQMYIETKLKIVRFIAELVKFNIFPKADSLHCMKMLLFDFSHHNIEMACALLDTCGRFLYRSPDSHHMTKVFLEVMMRKKSALHLDSRYNTMIENAFYYCNPPEYKKEEVRQRPPQHQYIRKLLYRDLNKVTTEKIIRQMRKIEWDNAELSAYSAKCMTSVWNMRYNVIHCCANLLAGLAPYHEAVAIRVIDGLMEDIRMGLELNHPKFNQRRMSCVKFLGELYNYRMVESSVIFKTLYSFITFGVFLEDGVVSVFDPPEHLLRVRLVCSLLDTCAQYFDRGSSKKKLDCFLVYFQRYYWFKRSNPRWTDHLPFPIEVEYSLQDTLESLRPKLELSGSYEAACEEVQQLERQLRAKLGDLFPTSFDQNSAANDDSALGTIQEQEEADSDDLNEDLSQLQLTLTDLTGDTNSQDSHTQHSDSQSQLKHRRGEDEEGEEGMMADDDDDNESVTSHEGEDDDDDDDVNLRTGGPKHINCSEDDDFMVAFDKMLTDNVQARNSESVKVAQLDIAVPMHMRSQKPKYGVVGCEDVEESVSSPIKFMLVTRRGNKQHFSSLDVPVSDDLAAKYREREEAEKREKERMKRMVLDMHERQEEEDYQDMLESFTRSPSSSGNPNMNRERRVRYQHPKGAPDADLIFGSKKR